MIFKRILPITLVVALGLSLAGCLGGGDGDSPSAENNPTTPDNSGTSGNVANDNATDPNTLTLAHLLPQSFGEVRSVNDGRYTMVERDDQGNIIHEFILFTDSEGLKLSKETWWVKPNDWEKRGTLHAGSPGAVKQEMVWDTPIMLAKAGMKVGDVYTYTTHERLLVYTNTPQTAHSDRCGKTDWNVDANQGKGETNPYRWEPITQHVTLTVLGTATVQHNGQPVSAIVLEYKVTETNVPFNNICSNVSRLGVRFWLAKDIGLVKMEEL